MNVLKRFKINSILETGFINYYIINIHVYTYYNNINKISQTEAQKTIFVCQLYIIVINLLQRFVKYLKHHTTKLFFYDRKHSFVCKKHEFIIINFCIKKFKRGGVLWGPKILFFYWATSSSKLKILRINNK